MPAPNKEVNKEAVHMLYIELGPTEAARRTGIKRGTVTKWASRYGWSQKRAVPLKRGSKPLSVSQLVAPVANAADPASNAAGDAPLALTKAHQEFSDATRTSLARATMQAARNAEAAAASIVVSSTGHLRELAASAARVFGWDAEKGAKAGDTYNTLVISADQLKQIGMLRGA